MSAPDREQPARPEVAAAQSRCCRLEGPAYEATAVPSPKHPARREGTAAPQAVIPPDVTALELPAARDAVAAAGWEVAETLETRSPRAAAGHGEFRVLRQRTLAPGKLQLVASHPNFDQPRRERSKGSVA